MAKMRANLDKGAFYEAQQMLKTVYYRYRSRRMLAESYDVLEDGACLQLQEGQVTAPGERWAEPAPAFATAARRAAGCRACLGPQATRSCL
jgi:hypothetical protein